MIRFKNDKDRQAFIEAYHVENGYSEQWKLWRQDLMLDRQLKKAELDGVAFIVEERLETITNPYTDPRTQIKYVTVAGYIVLDFEKWAHTGNRPFEDFRASKTMMLNKIKELEKRNK